MTSPLTRLIPTTLRAVCQPCSVPSSRAFVRPFSSTCLTKKSERQGLTAPIENWQAGWKYVALPTKDKATFVPPPRGEIQDPKSFLTAIGRNSAAVADKFKDWDTLFTTTSEQMEEEMGLKADQRKYILSWREWYKRGIDPYPVEIAKRQKKYLKRKAQVQLARLKRQGLA
ncbi:hypothetical protein HDU85_001200 [Gaertneriomyces sp. JEL0708]|nr:hypothetical protein HDU85_001200 [Gaertneriomyces sp. JEL0708]